MTAHARRIAPRGRVEKRTLAVGIDRGERYDRLAAADLVQVEICQTHNSLNTLAACAAVGALPCPSSLRHGRDTQHVEIAKEGRAQSQYAAPADSALTGTERPRGQTALLLEAQHASGVTDTEAAGILIAQAAAMPAGQTGTAGEHLQTAIHMLEQIKPEGALQSMLAVQMIGVHNSALNFLRRAMDEDQTFEGRDANVHRAVRLLRLFNEQLQSLTSLGGKTGQQKVTVEHVHVYDGGQAIVGSVDTPRGEENAN
jgi:hypothetical protein